MSRPPRAGHTLPPNGRGKEELRASLFKAPLLKLRDKRGEAAVTALLSNVGIPPMVMDEDFGWISVAAARRMLNALVIALGEEQLDSWGVWATHPEVLGPYVRLLRVASRPSDAYQYLASNSAETTRVGSYEQIALSPEQATIRYVPDSEVEPEQHDRLLCQARRAELVSIPRLWGMADAKIDEPQCLGRGHSYCEYVINWDTAKGRAWPFGVIGGAVLSGGAVAVTGSSVAALVAAGIGGGLGAVISVLFDNMSRQQTARIFERHRIVALERGLELRGLVGEPDDDLTGKTLRGKYRILRRIGSGGIGVVYAAEHLALGSQVAIKVLRRAAARDAAEVARLRREAQVQVSIEHPNVVRTLDLDQMADGSIYVVMELLQGLSLAEKLKVSRPLPASVAVPLFIQVCQALSSAHKLGIVHRDLKPGNVFICDDGSIKVLDFGMSKFSEAESLTQDGYTLGTPEYMSPEQCVGTAVEPRTDLYSLGVMMYEALSGDIPIRGRNRRELLELHQRAIPDSLRARCPELDLPEELDEAVLRCLGKRPADRPASAGELRRTLAAIPLERLGHHFLERPAVPVHGRVG